MQIILQIEPQQRFFNNVARCFHSVKSTTSTRGWNGVTPLPLSSPTPLQSTPWKHRRVTHGNSFIRIFTNENSRHLRTYEWAGSERLVKPHRRRRKENEGKNVRWGDTGNQPLWRERRKKYHFKQRLWTPFKDAMCILFPQAHARNREKERERKRERARTYVRT